MCALVATHHAEGRGPLRGWLARQQPSPPGGTSRARQAPGGPAPAEPYIKCVASVMRLMQPFALQHPTRAAVVRVPMGVCWTHPKARTEPSSIPMQFYAQYAASTGQRVAMCMNNSGNWVHDAGTGCRLLPYAFAAHMWANQHVMSRQLRVCSRCDLFRQLPDDVGTALHRHQPLGSRGRLDGRLHHLARGMKAGMGISHRSTPLMGLFRARHHRSKQLHGYTRPA